METPILAGVSGGGATASQSLEVGRVLVGTVAILKAQAPLLLALSILVVGGPELAQVAGLFEIQAFPRWLQGMIRLALSSAGDMVLIAVATAAAVGGDSWRRLPARFPAALLVGLAAGTAQVLGYVLLIIPGLLLQIMWIAAVPVCVAERPGFAALGRSAALTEGRRWPIFGLMIIYTVGAVAIALAVGAVVFAFRGALSNDLLEASVEGGAEVIMSAVGAAGCVALYLELLGIREGPAKSVAEVFS